MASVPCSIHVDFPSSSAAVATWSRPGSPFPSGLDPAGTVRTPPFLGLTSKLGFLRSASTARTVYGTQPYSEQIKLHSASRLFVRHRKLSKQVKFSVTSSNEVASEDSSSSSMDSQDISSKPSNLDVVNSERAANDSQLLLSNAQPTMSKPDKATPETQEDSTKRPPLTAREKLRAARVLSRYTESRPSRSELGSRVLDAIRETDRGKKRSGLPEAPSNLFDDSKRGLPKQGFTFNFPGSTDLFIIVFSFVSISTIMFATTYIVWKAGAIHFNEY